jgi:hypothetical protein
MRLAPVLLRAAATALFAVWGVPTAEPTWATPAVVAGPGERLVTYAGVTVRVPAAWPVHDLAAAPRTCVRYDVNAVYLGRPGADQDCPAHAMGRVETLSIEPRAVPRGRAVGAAASDPPDPSDPDQADPTDQTDPTAMTLSRRVGTAELTASYADDDSEATAILDSAQPARSAHSARRGTAADAALSTSDATAGDGSAPADTIPVVEPAAWNLPTARSRELKPVSTFAGSGFDTCAAPSLATMSVWKTASPFRAAGIYIGGSDRACPDGNLTPSWVRKVGAMGWHMFPIYVGRQASCWQDASSSKSKAPRIQHDRRWTEGVAAADDAAGRAAYFGLAPGSTVYFDMEYYPRAVTQCAQDVQAFLNSWTDELHKRGFLSGLYSSARGAVADMAQIYDTQSAYRPDAVWFAHWDAKARTSGDSVLSDKLWPGHQRIKQFSGGHDATYGGKKVNIDSDVLDAPVAALVSAKSASGDPARSRSGLTRPVPKDQQSASTQ